MPERERKIPGGGYALRLGKGRETRRLEAGESAAPRTVALVVVRVGSHRIAIEAPRVIEVRAGAVLEAADHPRRPIARADLHALLHEPARDSCQTVLARADGRIGRGDGARVSFAVDDCDRLVVVPIEAIGPLPPVAREQIEVDFLVGVAILPSGRSSEGTRNTADEREGPGATPLLHAAIERAAFLLDPARLARAAARHGEELHRG